MKLSKKDRVNVGRKIKITNLFIKDELQFAIENAMGINFATFKSLRLSK